MSELEEFQKRISNPNSYKGIDGGKTLSSYEVEFFENFNERKQEVEDAKEAVFKAIRELEKVCEKNYMKAELSVCDIELSYTPKRNENLERIAEFLSFSHEDGYWENSYSI
jgi:phosphopantetheinyl transferase (holo-ACP synthase)